MFTGWTTDFKHGMFVTLGVVLALLVIGVLLNAGRR